MSQTKTRVLVMFGGRSPEHDVSVITGIQSRDALDPDRYEAIPLYIAANGDWLTGERLWQRDFYMPTAAQREEVTQVMLHVGAGRQPHLITKPKNIFQKAKEIPFDVALFAFHGLIGEDGGIHGFFETANVPYTGMRLLASAVTMDKIAMKRILGGTDVPILPFTEIRRPQQGLMLSKQELEPILKNAQFPCCIKPSHLGSSIGVARVRDAQEVADVLPGIFRFDDTAMLEPFVENLVEYNVAVMRVNGEIRTSAIERPKRTEELLDFKTKYMSGGSKDGTKGGSKSSGGSEGMLSLTREINPDIPAEMESNIRKWAAQVYAQVDGTGAPRLDFLCNGKTGEVWYNEANPCPGSFGYFLWEAAKQPMLFTGLLDHLIAEAMTCHARRQIPMDPTPEGARLFPRQP